MVTVNIHEAKTQLSKLIDQAVKNEPFVYPWPVRKGSWAQRDD